MLPDKSKALRDEWEKAGNRPCDHIILVLERTENGYFTGQYVCTPCGAEICQKKA